MRLSPRALCSLSLLVTAASTSVAQQCEDFEGLAQMTAIDTLTGWRDASQGHAVFIETNPVTLSEAIVIDANNYAERRINNLGLADAFTVSFEVTAFDEGFFWFLCPPTIGPGGHISLNYRLRVEFEPSATPSVIRYGSDTLPLAVGVPTQMVVDVDTQGIATVTYGGQLLTQVNWGTLPAPCPMPASFALFSYNGGPNSIGMAIDDVCISSQPWSRYCSTAPNSTGVVGKIRAFGSASITTNDFSLLSTDLPANQFGYYLAGTAQGFVANPGGSLGNLCLGGAIGRFPLLTTGAAGQAANAVDWTGIPHPSGSVMAMVGDTWNFQLYHRDFVGGASVTNFTEGLSVTVTL